jgi:acetyl esterase/lipase
MGLLSVESAAVIARSSASSQLELRSSNVSRGQVNGMRVVFQWLSLLVSVLGFLLSNWIVIPAPTLLLLPLSVGAPEVSPWLLILNALSLLLALKSATKYLISRIACGLSVIGLVLCLLPLSQIPATNQQSIAAMSAGLGTDYLTAVPRSAQDQMRAHPFALTDVFRGIPQRAVRYTPDIPFTVAEGVPLSLDIYRPPEVGQYPGIVVIYGGAWHSGSPKNNVGFSRYMAARGYVVWAIDYRHAPQFKFPAQIDDIEAALAFLHSHAAEYETDPNHIALVGRSAGAQLAMLAAYHPDQLPVQAIVDYYGPVDLTTGYYDIPRPSPIDIQLVLNHLFGGSPREFPDLYALASPLDFVTSSAPPSLLIYAGRDHVVQAKYGQKLHQRLQSVGGKVVYLEIPWADHAFDAVFNGISSQMSLYYTERFLAWALLAH